MSDLSKMSKSVARTHARVLYWEKRLVDEKDYASKNKSLAWLAYWNKRLKLAETRLNDALADLQERERL